MPRYCAQGGVCLALSRPGGGGEGPWRKVTAGHRHTGAPHLSGGCWARAGTTLVWWPPLASYTPLRLNLRPGACPRVLSQGWGRGSGRGRGAGAHGWRSELHKCWLSVSSTASMVSVTTSAASV
ncbi:hypothetical protein E2C01_097947 [Portunus trituberculatus]|uniref:Uncharacterized protein n=1 Tax=Portunus trituberculatus TaxID=210409 RepID=A0A5B7KBK6_PORTR|nr:hypothetical protein [Portunus trituberculatus]